MYPGKPGISEHRVAQNVGNSSLLQYQHAQYQYIKDGLNCRMFFVLVINASLQVAALYQIKLMAPTKLKQS